LKTDWHGLKTGDADRGVGVLKWHDICS